MKNETGKERLMTPTVDEPLWQVSQCGAAVGVFLVQPGFFVKCSDNGKVGNEVRRVCVF